MTVLMETVAESGKGEKSPVSKHRFSLCVGNKQADARRDRQANSQARTGTENFHFPVQLITSRDGNHTPLA